MQAVRLYDGMRTVGKPETAIYSCLGWCVAIRSCCTGHGLLL